MGRELTHTLTTGTAHRRTDHREGILAKTIEEQTAKLPSDTFLWAATRSIAASLALKIMGRDKDALFVGQWGTNVSDIRPLQQTCEAVRFGSNREPALKPTRVYRHYIPSMNRNIFYMTE